MTQFSLRPRRFFYAHQDVTHLQRYTINDNTTGQTVAFTRLMIGEVKGYAIDYTSIQEPQKRNII